MALKSAQGEPEKAGMIEELLDHCETTLDRVKTLYEQYFLGIQKQPPTHLHTDVERKLRELQQIQIRNTALRYRFATVQQKLGSYNNYWRRTLRQIENGTYHRNLAKIGRQAIQSGEEIPEEILAAMPKRMREQVKRDREAALARQRRREGVPAGAAEDAVDVDLALEFADEDVTGVKATPVKKTASGAHVLEEHDSEFDLDAYFAAVTNDDAAPVSSISQTAMPVARAPDAPRAAARPAQPARPAPDAVLVRAQPARPAVAEDTNPEAAPFDDEEDVAIVSSRPAPPSEPPPIKNPTSRTPPLGFPQRRPQPVSPALHESQVIATTAIPTVRTPLEQRMTVGSAPTTPTTPAGPPGPVTPTAPVSPTTAIPALRTPAAGLPSIPAPRPIAPSQVARPLSVMPGAASSRGVVPVETMSGPFPREAARAGTEPGTQAIPRPLPAQPPGQAMRASPAQPNVPASEHAPTQAIPRAAIPPASEHAPTQAIPRSAIPPRAGSEPHAPTQAIPRAGMQQPPSPTQAIPRSAIQPRAGTEPNAPTQAIPRTGMPPSPTQAIPRSAIQPRAGTEPNAPTQAIPRPAYEPNAIPRAAPVRAGTEPRVSPPPPPVRTGADPQFATQAIPRTPNADPQAQVPRADFDAQTMRSPIADPQGRPAVRAGTDPQAATQAIPRPPIPRSSPQAPTQAIPRPPPPPPQTQAIPRQTQAIPKPTQAIPRMSADGNDAPRSKPPPGMTDADVNALYSKYVKAKEAVGEKTGPGSYGKLLQTINAQAPKIMEQYKAKGVEFQVVVKDNQVVIRAKPKP